VDPEEEAAQLREWIAVCVRAARRRLGLSQRAYAARAGMHQPGIARIEAGVDARLSTVVAALAAADLYLVPVTARGAPAERTPHPSDTAVDSAGHRLPAHLDSELSRWVPSWTHTRRILERRPMPRPGGFWLYHHRPAAAPDAIDADGIDTAGGRPDAGVSGT
jgi:transcriptional regulator with XRE-family HTH domain